MKNIITIFLFILITACDASNSEPDETENITHSTVSQGLTLEWHDEFNGDELDRTKWEAPNNMPRQGASHWMKNQVSVSDGKLRLGITKTENPPNVNYDCGAVRTKEAYLKELFTQTYGYFEARVKLPENITADYWAAFWMMSGTVADDQPNTQQGHEIDIMESFTIGETNGHKLTMHWNGYGTKHNMYSLDLGIHPQLSNGEYHTYGLYWDQDKYISYVDGFEVGRTDFLGEGEDANGKTLSNGPSRSPAYIKLSCEAAMWPGGPGWEEPLPETDQFLIDYVRVYSGTKE